MEREGGGSVGENLEGGGGGGGGTQAASCEAMRGPHVTCGVVSFVFSADKFSFRHTTCIGLNIILDWIQ
jgi:hypothetical protein